MGNLYQEIIVWCNLGDSGIARYMCFMNLATSKYSVQSCDFYHLPLDDTHMVSAKRQAVELFAQTPPDERSGGFDSLEIAIKKHNELFASA